MQNWAIVERNRQCNIKLTIHIPSTWLGNLQERLGIYMTEMKTYVHIKPVHEYTLHNNPKLETTQMCSNGGTNKLTVVHPHNGVLLGN